MRVKGLSLTKGRDFTLSLQQGWGGGRVREGECLKEFEQET